MTKLIVLEGIDGTGKSTVADRINQERSDVEVFHEPFGSLGDYIRVHGADFTAQTKALLFSAARQEFVTTVLKPALAKTNVLLDRFTASTIAYQVFGDGNDFQDTINLIRQSTKGLQEIDATILLEVSDEKRQERIANRHDNDGLDDYEQAYYQRVADNYPSAISSSGSIENYLLDTNKSSDAVFIEVSNLLDEIIYR